MTLCRTHAASLTGTVTVPGDKSISHRAVMLGAITDGVVEIDGFLMGDDCLATIRCLRALGIRIEVSGEHVTVYGQGLRGLRKPDGILDVSNSGTALRLLTGLLAGQRFDCTLTGDASIQKRPMDRVTKPLTLMGACLEGNTAPVTVRGGELRGIRYTLPMASAQVKSAILLAGLYASGETTVIEPQPTRDHTEIMLQYFGADIRRSDGDVTVQPAEKLAARPVTVPGDISSAAFPLVAAAITPGAALTVANVGVNETRTGIIKALADMGADISVHDVRECCGERVGNITVRHACLKATTVSGALVPTMIDEIPALAVAALFAKGRTVIRDAAELKVKESNRIRTVAMELSKMGAHITETDDGLLIDGGYPLHGAVVDSHADHRLAMSLAVAALNAEGETTINGSECVDVSFPGFFTMLANV